MPAPSALKLYVDVLSPFSFLAYTTVRRYQGVWNLDLQVAPVLLAGLMAGSNNTPPMARPGAEHRAKWYLTAPVIAP
jgi:glutathione S-transferase kappa 1